MEKQQIIFLVGLTGSGKSTAGRLAADALGFDFSDSDRVIEGRQGVSISELFSTRGEARFREVEGEVIRGYSTVDKIVVATGGGAVTTEVGLEALTNGFAVWLRISPQEAARRLMVNPGAEERPLLATPYIAGQSRENAITARLTEMLAARETLYAQSADAIVDVDGLTAVEVARDCVARWRGAAARVETPGGSYDIIVRDGALDGVGRECRTRGLKGRAFVITDENAGPLFEDRLLTSLGAADYPVDVLRIAAGEEHKTLESVNRVYDWLIGHRIERQDFVVSLGGGVVTDLAGFAAATILRGIDFVHVPTSMLAMVDASVGGKTGVDHPRGKNLIGAFAQPRAVIIDPQVLKTLPERQLRNGWAEVIKHGLILDAKLMADLEAAATQPGVMLSADLIARSVAIKARIVSEDEREAGRRTLLNYGHTLGHAIEAITGYDTYLHGEAVAIGMRAAGLMAVELGVLARGDFERQQALIRASGLPERAPGLDVDALLDATLQDKKVRAGAVQWVLLRRLGEAYVHGAIDTSVVLRAVQRVTE